MPIPARLAPDADAERIMALAAEWRIDCELAVKLHKLAMMLPFSISIFSGYRTAEQQAELRKNGTGARDELSTHRSCPATGADVKPSIAADDSVKIRMGTEATLLGLRWGGGAPRDRKGIPVHPEWMHFDLGPRQGSSYPDHEKKRFTP